MNRTLKRPMFRIGGKADGITSGLDAPRQNYQSGMTVTPMAADRLRDRMTANAAAMKPDALSIMAKGFSGNKDNLQSTANMATGSMSRDEIIAQAMADAQKYSGGEPMSRNEMLARFLIPFGLNFASATPSGNIFADAARSAVDPAAQLAAAIDKRRDTTTAKEADLFGALLTSGLSERREDKKLASEKLKESQELLTLYDRELKRNVIVKAKDVYSNLENYEPAKTDKEGRTFEKLEVSELIEENMTKIFELEAKETKTAIDLQNIEIAKEKLKFLQGSKDTNAFANAILKDPEELRRIRTAIKNKLETTERFAGTLNETKELELRTKIDEALRFYIENGVFPPNLLLADGGRAGYQMGGDVDPMAEETPKIDYDTLRARLPKEITDDIVKLIASSPEALEDFATIQTQQDVVIFNSKYNVELVLPAEA